jgi:hypothetical protein
VEAVKSVKIKEAADYLGLHVETLAGRARAGKIPGAAKLGKCWTFEETALVAYRNAHSPCPSTGAENGGGSTSPRTQAELESLLGLPTGKRRRNTTRSGSKRYGAGTSSARQSR